MKKRGVQVITKDIDLGNAIVHRVVQTSHGFSVGQPIRSSGTANEYALAQADTPENAEVIGVVQLVEDTDTFYFAYIGMITGGVPDEPVNTVLFLSETTPGALTATEPSPGFVSRPVAIVLEPEVKMLFLPYRGVTTEEFAPYEPRVNTVASFSSTITPDYDEYDGYHATAQDDTIEINLPDNLALSAVIVLRFEMANTETFTPDANYKWAVGKEPPANFEAGSQYEVIITRGPNDEYLASWSQYII